MYITVTRKKYKDRYYEQVLLRESYREDGKVKTRTIANLTKLPKEQINALKAALSIKSDTIVSKKQQQGKTVGLSYIIISIMKLLNIFKILNKNFESKIALMLIAARIVLQSSRLQALYWIKDIDKISSLVEFNSEELDRLNDKTIYKGLDYLYKNQQTIEDRLFKLNYTNKKIKPKRLYYDVTSSYVEGDYEDSLLVEYGYNRDKKKGKKQIVIGLLTDENGRALSCDVYPGNTNDVKTFDKQLQKAKKRFNIDNITIVGDGGMIKSNDIETIKSMGYDYITSIGKNTIKKMCDDKSSKMDYTLFDEDLKEIIEDDTRYILRLNPIRQKEIRDNRKRKIQSLKEFIKNKQKYYNTHYKAKKETLQKDINNFIKKLKLDKFIIVEFEYKEKEIELFNKKNNKTTLKTKEIATDIKLIIDEDIKKEIELLDGCYVIKTSLTNTNKDTKEEIHKAYKELIKVENAFKTLKSEFLEIRPLYLKTDNRIKGHIFLSMLAYNIVYELKRFSKEAEVDFKSTIEKLKNIHTVKNILNDYIFETIPAITDKSINKLLEVMKLKFPVRCKH
jgi:transposase